MFTEDDLIKYRALKLVIEKLPVEAKLETVKKIAIVLKWLDDLEDKIKSDIEKSKE